MVTTHRFQSKHTARASSSLEQALVDVANLTVAFPAQDGRLTAVVRDVSFAIQPNEVLALVGESGSGKTQTALAMLGLTRPPGRVTGGSIRIEGEEIIGAPEATLQRIRGSTVAMIFQSPRTSLNPLKTVGDQLGRVYQ